MFSDTVTNLFGCRSPEERDYRIDVAEAVLLTVGHVYSKPDENSFLGILPLDSARRLGQETPSLPGRGGYETDGESLNRGMRRGQGKAYLIPRHGDSILLLAVSPSENHWTLGILAKTDFRSEIGTEEHEEGIESR